jgi:predicted  nucleic acid-binding Zn-ribbon protein
MKSPLNSEEKHIYEQIKDLKTELQKFYKDHKDSSLASALLEQAKLLTQLVEQREVAESLLSNLDTPLFSLDKQIKKLDKPLQDYADRVAFWIKKGDLFKEQQFSDINNFIQFAQRKGKVMKIYCRLSIIRTRSMIHDLVSQ